MTKFDEFYQSSIGKKQIVAVTGLLLIGYVIVHLAGNLLIYTGPKVFNMYADKMASLRPGLYVIEVVLLLIFVIHIYTTAVIILENMRARSSRYAVSKSKGERTLATRLMPYTGFILLAFVVWHIYDFTLIDKYGPRSVLSDGQSYGLYGVVYNSFSDTYHSGFYIIAMMALGFHLSHGIQSFMQTFGYNEPRHTSLVKGVGNTIALAIAFGFSSIPVYVLINSGSISLILI